MFDEYRNPCPASRPSVCGLKSQDGERYPVIWLPNERSTARPLVSSASSSSRESRDGEVCVYPWCASSWPAFTMASTRPGCRSATRPGTKNVARTPRRSSRASRAGTATFAPYVPCDSTPGRWAFSGSSPIHTSSASKSNVNEAAQRAPSGHMLAGPPLSSRLSAGNCVFPGGVFPRGVWTGHGLRSRGRRLALGGPRGHPVPGPGDEPDQATGHEHHDDQQERAEDGQLDPGVVDQGGLHDREQRGADQRPEDGAEPADDEHRHVDAHRG